jgi:integrase
MFSNCLATESALKKFFMATIREVILPNQKREDGTWNVKIRVTHQRKINYISTTHYVGVKQIRPDHTIKDPIILTAIYPTLTDYRNKISDLGPKLETFDLPRLIKYLTDKMEIAAEEINVISFGRNMIAEMKAAGRDGSAHTINTVINGLTDFFGTEFIPVTEIRATMLVKYEKFLRSEREITRFNQFQKEVTRTMPGLSHNGLHNHMRDLRILFNAIRNHYNDEDLGCIIVKHYPFKKYKLVRPTENKKPKLTVKQVIAIRDFEAKAGSRMELARDLFMVSFYLCGMNAVDLYKIPEDTCALKRVDYNRSKTSSRRRDNAFISINIPEVALPLYIKYAGKLYLRYCSHNALDTALSKGMQAMGKELKINDPEFYDARHAFGDWARNICRFSKDDVALALNHKDQTNSVTDYYVSKNWKIIDEVQTAVIRLLDNKNKKIKKAVARTKTL